MIVVASTAWSAVAAEINEDATAGLLTHAFRSLKTKGGSRVDRRIVARVDPDANGNVLVTTAEGVLTRSAGMAAALVVATEMNRGLLDRCPDFAVHAAVLASQAGVLAMPAESGTGKSTLAAACLQRGFGYVSDEALVLTPNGVVLPYPRPLALSAWSRAAIGITGPPGTADPSADSPDEEGLVDPLEVGRVAAASCATRVHAIIRLRRCSGAPSLTRMPRSQGAVELLRNSFNHFRDPAGSVALAHEVAARAEAFELSLPNPNEAADLLAAHFGT